MIPGLLGKGQASVPGWWAVTGIIAGHGTESGGPCATRELCNRGFTVSQSVSCFTVLISGIPAPPLFLPFLKNKSITEIPVPSCSFTLAGCLSVGSLESQLSKRQQSLQTVSAAPDRTPVPLPWPLATTNLWMKKMRLKPRHIAVSGITICRPPSWNLTGSGKSLLGTLPGTCCLGLC